MKLNLILIIIVICFSNNAFAQKKKQMPYFSREVSIRDSITLSIINQYIEKVGEKKEKVVRLSIAGVGDTIFYHFEAIATIKSITDYFKPFFLFQYKGYFFLVDNGVGGMLQGNEAYAEYITKKLKKYLVQGETSVYDGDGVKLATFMTFDPPIMYATFSRGGVTIKWEGL